MNTEQIAAACGRLGRHLEAYRAKPDSMADLQQCLELLASLREQYRQDKAAFAPHLDQLRDLSRQIHDLLVTAAEGLTQQYLDASGQIRAWEAIRETCRDALTELAEARKLTHFSCAAGQIDVKQFHSVQLPPQDSPQRRELYDLLTRTGCWAEVGAINTAKLSSAITGGRLPPDVAAQLARLCPLEASVRLTVRTAGSR